MAISGNLNDFPLEDVLKTVRSRTGTLYLYSALGGKSIELSLHKNHILSVFTDGFPVQDKARATHLFKQLLLDAHGKFNFQDEEHDRLERFYLMPVFSLVTQTQFEREASEADLPHPQTRFRVVGDLPAVPAVLGQSWSRAYPVLRGGASAEGLAEQLGSPLRDALVTLYRFRAAGLIELAYWTAPGGPGPAASTAAPPPLQSISYPAATAVPQALHSGPQIVTTETRSVLQRLLHRLRGRGAA